VASQRMRSGEERHESFSYSSSSSSSRTLPRCHGFCVRKSCNARSWQPLQKQIEDEDDDDDEYEDDAARPVADRSGASALPRTLS
jgi:hypothetical protein